MTGLQFKVKWMDLQVLAKQGFKLKCKTVITAHYYQWTILCRVNVNASKNTEITRSKPKRPIYCDLTQCTKKCGVITVLFKFDLQNYFICLIILLLVKL